MSLIKRFARWARITKAGTDTEQFAVQQMSYLGKVGDGIIVFPYGVHGNVPADSLALMFAVGGDAENRAAIAWTPKDRPKLQPGEVAFYHPPTDSTAIWREDGTLEIVAAGDVSVDCVNAVVNASGQTTITTPTLTLNGNLVVNGTMTNNGKDVGDTHGHAQGPDSGGSTEQNISGVL